MIYGDATAGGDNLAQVGWAIEPAVQSNPHYFFGWFVDGTYYEKRNQWGPAENTWHSYQVSIEGDGYIHGFADDAEIWKIYSFFTPTGVQYANEHDNNINTYYQGTTSNKSTFRNVKYYNGNYARWGQPSLTFFNDSYGGLDTTYWSSSGYFNTWDTRR